MADGIGRFGSWAKLAPYLGLGAFFGIVLSASQAISWYRIQEMFRFQSFHMYGIIGSAVAVAAASLWLLRRFGAHDIDCCGSILVSRRSSASATCRIIGANTAGRTNAARMVTTSFATRQQNVLIRFAAREVSRLVDLQPAEPQGMVRLVPAENLVHELLLVW